MKKEEAKPSNPDFHKGQISLIQDRVTLRDHFAGLSLQSIMTSESFSYAKTPVQMAETAYIIADAMLKQRES